MTIDELRRIEEVQVSVDQYNSQEEKSMGHGMEVNVVNSKNFRANEALPSLITEIRVAERSTID